MRKETGKQAAKTDDKPFSGDLISDIRRLIETARHNVAVTVNAGLTIIYRQIPAEMKKWLEKYLDELTKGKKPCKV
ncbi:MAG: hypothetical protein E3J94_02950, partial [Desulfobacteraceae bacterium]